MDLALTAWPLARSAPSLSAKSKEEDFTGELVIRMRELKELRGLQFHVIPEAGTFRRGGRKTSGRIDILVPDGFTDRLYFGLECKRVHSRRKTLGKKYVDEGVMRFVNGKYAPDLSHGAMIGFVLDGRCAECADLIRETLASWPGAAITRAWSPSSAFGAAANLYTTEHGRDASPIEIIHVLLPV